MKWSRTRHMTIGVVHFFWSRRVHMSPILCSLLKFEPPPEIDFYDVSDDFKQKKKILVQNEKKLVVFFDIRVF